MHSRFAGIIEYFFRDETLSPGDFISSGTVSGGGRLELDRWLQPGDIVELEANPLADLRNRVARSSLLCERVSFQFRPLLSRLRRASRKSLRMLFEKESVVVHE